MRIILLGKVLNSVEGRQRQKQRGKEGGRERDREKERKENLQKSADFGQIGL